MTNEQAISIMTIQRPRTGTKEKLEAYDMAVKALELQDEIEKRVNEDKVRAVSFVFDKNAEILKQPISATQWQEPCNDCISRAWLKEAVHNFFYGLKHSPTEEDIQAYIDAAPSDTPQQKMGHWIEKAEDYYKAINEYGGGVDENTDYFTDDIACPKCLSKFSTIDNETERFRHCPNCGCRMVEPQESEDKE